MTATTTEIETVEDEAPEPTETEIALAGEVDQLRAALSELRQERNAWRTARIADDEAEVISSCVRALDAFLADSRSTGTHSANTAWSIGTSNPSGTVYVTDTGRVGRVLRYLAERYHVELVPNVQVLCQHEDPS